MNEQEPKDSTTPIWSTPKIEEFDINNITQGKPTPFGSEFSASFGPS